MTIKQSTLFIRIVKRYAHFIKSEELDQTEFKFGDKMVNLKQRENLGETPERVKYRGPSSLSTKHVRGPQYAREKRDVETVAFVKILIHIPSWIMLCSL